MPDTYALPDGYDGRVRTYRLQRSRRVKPGGEKAKNEAHMRMGEKMATENTTEPYFRTAEEKIPTQHTTEFLMRMGEEEIATKPTTESQESDRDGLRERDTLCLPSFSQHSIAHRGDEGFTEAIRQYFPLAESNANERLVHLKSRLRNTPTDDFWGILMEEMCDITGSQCGIVAKRILVDDRDSTTKMPELGEPGSCLMGVALYINNGTNVKKMWRDYQYHAYDTPCAYMKHDKVFIVPERMAEVCRNNLNDMPFVAEAFLGAPLFAEGKSFAHFGLIWSTEGAARRKLSWSYIELFMHSLEDMILQRILEGRVFGVAPPDSKPAKVIPLSALTASQSLKPYARSLSHELRTPMQGVVGILDIMYSTVVDAIANQPNDVVRSIFKDLKNSIEVVQDSSRRAIEAADNVVHAYDVNMQMPETPLSSNDGTKAKGPSHASRDCPGRVLEDVPSPKKRGHSEEVDFHLGPPSKKMFTMAYEDMLHKDYKEPENTVLTIHKGTAQVTISTQETLEESNQLNAKSHHASSEKSPSAKTSPTMKLGMTNLTYHRVIIRDFMRSILTNVLRSAHPTSEVHIESALGETINVRSRGPRGESRDIMIHLKIEQQVPEIINTQEQHLHFCLQKVIDNAIKFTESGSITITVNLAKNSQLLEIQVVDTGCGMTDESKSNLFKPHFQEDASTSRSRDGLGLSLFNTKAKVRKFLGGDITLERSATDGPCKGSEFLIRLPIPSPTTPTELIAAPLVSTPTITIMQGESHRPVPHSTPGAASMLLFGTPTAATDQGETHRLSVQSTPRESSNTILGISTTATGPRQPRRPSQQSLYRRSFTSLSSKETSFSSETMSGENSSQGSSRRRVSFNRELAKEYLLNILIAEDNPVNQNVIVGCLIKLGYSRENITIAFDGVEAVQKYEASLAEPPAKRFGAVLMDIWMPRMDGYEATKRIVDLARKNAEQTTIIAVTADITSDCKNRANAVGMQGFLSKPFTVSDVEHMIMEKFTRA